MLTLHHLNDSRSQRILWLLEELGTPYEMKRYQRDAETRLAPPELKAIHPLGKSPVITDGDNTIAESGAIVDYIIRKYGKGAMMPAPGSADYEAYNEWLHYSEGSAMLPLMLNLYCQPAEGGGRAAASAHRQRDGQPSRLCRPRAQGPGILRRPVAVGADIQMSFVGEMAKVFEKLDPYPNLAAWLTRMHARPAFQRRSRRAGRTVCVSSLRRSGASEARAGAHTPRPGGRGTLADAFSAQRASAVMGPGSRPGRRRVGAPGLAPPPSPPYLA